ncbi:major facilitator transporter [Sphingobium indicum IP26]|uniref:Major facilitator transporter n=1 Tax=Sphingobium indicum F2 TaxID=1450518 RepID=A0A8E1C3I5_9SPHN|nr:MULTISPECIES: MFS transporter [Sphingobium]EPR09736.1 major facilitator transporter [Sphingobium indicum IP26]EQB04925.1 major facilitator transporter [Sphingobium sp. HDIP04]KER37314.1 major facilitator transporter [Sphingobium indicum F2]
MVGSAGGTGYVMDARRDRLVITASALGTLFEWYDFYIYGVLAPIIGRTFFPTDNPTVELLYSLAGFAIGFGFRPLGAALFGYLGDRLGRKYTFLATIVLMGAATAGVGLTPSAASIGIAAPIILILLRIAQGLALGGEYGGAAIYVAEHAPPGKRGFYTSFIQAGVIGGFVLSLIVVVGTQWVVGKAVWEDWGWRLPFIFSLALLAISLWMRLMLRESPIFAAMKAAGEQSRNPLKEAFTYPGNRRRMLVAMIGLAAGFTVIAYTAMFQALYFLQNGLHVTPGMAQLLVGGSAFVGVGSFVFFGWLSDRVGRKKPIIVGYALLLALLLPLYQFMGSVANPALYRAAERAPVVVSGPDCSFDPFAKVQLTACGKLLDHFSRRGIAYEKREAAAPSVSIGSVPVADLSPHGLDAALHAGGYDSAAVTPDWPRALLLFVALLLLWTLSGATYGPVAALLSEYFPARIRYSSLSIPYHIGTGYFGGFLPLVSQYIVARTGDPYAGLWYTMAVVAVALLTCIVALPETRGAKMD